MDAYDPLVAPDSEVWLALDEGERLILIEQYHRDADVDLPNFAVHAAIHAAVENQLASNLAPVCEAFTRLMSEGLNRHDAIHAIGSVLAAQLFELMRVGKAEPTEPNERYFRSLRELTAARWLRDR